MQAAIQRWTDSSISKTINCPNDWTVDQIGEVYQRLYDKGCKGGSVYRDGCRMEQVLEAPKADSPTAAPAVRDYPGVRDSKTVSLGTPCGTVHVTLTHISGEPLEVFATTGKAGSEVMALTEAVGRLLSLVLRVDSPVSPSERLRLALEQLEGIGGSNPIGLGPNRVSSLPDGIGKALRKAWLPMTPVVECPDDLDVSSVQVKILSGDLCPSCGGMARHEGGCITCSCGWSKCG
jgi:ribonucleoside-diphosphate reductase alpha chain